MVQNLVAVFPSHRLAGDSAIPSYSKELEPERKVYCRIGDVPMALAAAAVLAY